MSNEHTNTVPPNPFSNENTDTVPPNPFSNENTNTVPPTPFSNIYAGGSGDKTPQIFDRITVSELLEKVVMLLSDDNNQKDGVDDGNEGLLWRREF